MWPTTAFSVPRRSIQEIRSNLKSANIKLNQEFLLFQLEGMPSAKCDSVKVAFGPN